MGHTLGYIKLFRLMVHASFIIKDMIHGYHIYRDIWSNTIAEKFSCKKEQGNDLISIEILVGSNFRTICMCSKYAKICTIRKFPTIRHYHTFTKSNMATNCITLVVARTKQIRTTPSIRVDK